MAVSVRELEITGTRLSLQAKSALSEYAERVWQIPEARLVYGYQEDEWLVAVAVGEYLQHEDRYRIYGFQREIESEYPQINFGFKLRDQKNIPHEIPDLGDDEVHILKRPRRA